MNGCYTDYFRRNSHSVLELFHSVFVAGSGFQKQILTLYKLVLKHLTKFSIMNIIIFTVRNISYSESNNTKGGLIPKN